MTQSPTLSFRSGWIAIAALAGGASAAPVFTLVNEQAGIDTRFVPNGYPGDTALQSGGAAVADFNNDGWPDLFLPQGGTGPDRLYINQQDGTFSEEGAAWGLTRRLRSAGVAVGDFDNDGYQDLFVVNYGDFPFPPNLTSNVLYRNLGPDEQGRFRFEDVASEAGVTQVADLVAGTGATFGDMDLDGDLDLFVSSWVVNAGGNRLFENNGDGTFTRVPPERLPVPGTTLRGFTPNFADLNGDRYPELLLANDFRTSRLYANTFAQGGDLVYEDITLDAGIFGDCNGMGATLADFDNDGQLDWFITNIYVEVANPPCGNTLFRATEQRLESGVPVYEEIAVERGVANSGWGWGTTAFDVDNDGDPDIATTGGWPSWLNEPARLYINNGAGVFSNQESQAGIDWLGQGRSLVHLDYDLDGRVDLLFTERDGPARLYRNESTLQGNWIRVDLDTSANPCLAPRGFGALVTVHANGESRTQLLDGRTTFLGQSERVLHFGAGSDETIESIEVSWVDGFVTTLTDVEVNQTVIVRAKVPADFDASGVLNFFDIAAYLNAYVAGDPRTDFDQDGTVGPADISAFVARFIDPCG
ncbi:MAG: CRTAC1 family protein [Planctomycetota bacterium]